MTAIILREFVYEITNIDLDNIQKVILFGSVAKHTATIQSDIDIAIIFKNKNPKVEIEITSVCGQIAQRFDREIQPHYFTEDEFQEMKKKRIKLVEEIIKDGISLM